MFIPGAQRAPFAEHWGANAPVGAVEIDPVGHTSVERVYAAGDMAHVAALPAPVVSLAAAIAAGQVAASAVVRDSILHGP